jgi:hypothetical protein
MKVVYSLLILSFFISCKKENINIRFPENLYITKIESVTTARLFTNKSEITDTTIINDFIGQSDYFNIQNQAIDPTERISFFTKDTVTFGSSLKKFSVKKSGN